MPSQPYALACEGGLDKSSSSFELLRRPGAATRLRNFEVDIAGGYRRINGSLPLVVVVQLILVQIMIY